MVTLTIIPHSGVEAKRGDNDNYHAEDGNWIGELSEQQITERSGKKNVRIIKKRDFAWRSESIGEGNPELSNRRAKARTKENRNLRSRRHYEGRNRQRNRNNARKCTENEYDKRRRHFVTSKRSQCRIRSAGADTAQET